MADRASTPTAAAAIYQHNFNAVTRALWTCDLALIPRHIALPNQMLTEDAEIIIASADEMLLLMIDFREALATMGADGYARIRRSAAFLPGRTNIIHGRHATCILRNGTSLRPPCLNDMTLIHSQDGHWRGIRIEARTSNTDATILSPDLADAQAREFLRLGRADTIDLHDNREH